MDAGPASNPSDEEEEGEENEGEEEEEEPVEREERCKKKLGEAKALSKPNPVHHSFSRTC